MSANDLTLIERTNVFAALKFLRLRCGVTILSKALRLEEKTLENMIQKKAVTPLTAFRVARLANVPVDDVLTGRFPALGACSYCGRADTNGHHCGDTQNKQKTFSATHPNVHPIVRDFYPDFDYHSPAKDREVIRDMSDPRNVTGHQQRAVTIWWALKMCSPIDLGLDIGSHRGLTPFCIHIDRFYDGKTPHPSYGGVLSADVVMDCTRLDGIFPPATFPYIASNHSLEHMPGNDIQIVDILASWMCLLRHGGVLAMVIPDNAHFPVLQSDPDHKNAWSHIDFRPRVLNPLFARGGVEIVEYDTLDNHYSFQVVLRKTLR
jgi:hypothetical protein